MADEQGHLQSQQLVQSATDGPGTVLLSSSATPVEFSWQEAAVSTVTDLHNAAAAATDAASQQLLAAHNLLPPPPAEVSADAAAQASGLAATPLSGEDAAMHLQAFEQLQPADAFLKAQAAQLPGTSAGTELAEQVRECWSYVSPSFWFLPLPAATSHGASGQGSCCRKRLTKCCTPSPMLCLCTSRRAWLQHGDNQMYLQQSCAQPAITGSPVQTS